MPLLLVPCGVAVCAPLGAQGLGAQGRAPNTCFWISLLGPRRGENRHFRGGGAPPRRHAVSRGGRGQLGRRRRYLSIRVARAPSQRQIGPRGGAVGTAAALLVNSCCEGPFSGINWAKGGAVGTAAALLFNLCCEGPFSGTNWAKGGCSWDGSGVTFQFVLRGPLLGGKSVQAGVR